MRIRPAIALFVATIFSASQAVAWRGSDAITVGTSPEGATVSIDGEYLGDTPLNVPVPCNEVVDRRYRIEHPDCGVEEGIVNARPRPGVIVGMVFTLGILAAFMCPRYFVPVRLALGGGRCNRVGDTAPRPIGSNEPANNGGDLAVRLRILKDLHDRGVLTDQQYEQERENALNGL